MNKELYYFTSKIEIKPQPMAGYSQAELIILHQRLKSNHNSPIEFIRPDGIILHQR